MGVLLSLKISPEDMGQVIGRQGATARSIRNLVRIVGLKNQARVNLKIEEPEGGRVNRTEETKETKETKNEQIFDLFYSTKMEGRGLGLPVSLSIVQNHGGHINFSSIKGVGSTFNIYLPIVKEIVEKPIISHDELKPRKISVLLMDDNEDIHKFIRRVFKKFNIPFYTLISTTRNNDD